MSLFKKLFRRREKEKRIEEKAKEEVEGKREKVSEVKPVVKVAKKIPTFREKLSEILSNETVIKSALDVGDIKIQFVAGSESLFVKSVGRMGAKKLEISEGRTSNPDIFVRISEDAALDLAKTKSYDEFIVLLKQLIGRSSRDKYVRVNCLKSIDELRSKGYLNVDLLKIFAMA